jgi:hypothetical protein
MKDLLKNILTKKNKKQKNQITSKNCSTRFGEIFEFVAKLHGLSGATRRVVLRIEVQNHDFAIVRCV